MSKYIELSDLGKENYYKNLTIYPEKNKYLLVVTLTKEVHLDEDEELRELQEYALRDKVYSEFNNSDYVIEEVIITE